MVNAKTDFVTALVLTAFGAAVTVESWRMPRFEPIGGSLATAPGLVPGLLGLVLVAFGVVMLVRSLRQGALRDQADAAGEQEGGTGEGARRLLLMLTLSVGYAGGLVGRMPFWLATFVFVFVSVAVFDWQAGDPLGVRLRRLAVAVAVALPVAFGVAFVFEEIFLVNLP